LAKRLTEIQKKIIINDFVNGVTVDQLAMNFSCTKVTIVRTLKKNLSLSKYDSILKRKETSQINLSERIVTSDELVANKEENDDLRNEERNLVENRSEEVDNYESYSETTFMEIAPLDYEINNETQKDLSSVSISEIDFPKIVYMIVDSKIELEIKSLGDYPNWQFLSQDELKRKTIEIYFDLKIAKKFCRREQKVIKVPNTDVFRVVSPILISRGISRIVCPDKLIAL
tara:strand:+ start:16 stop:702 length:687 start_codon:yes stop_codon:yes gene_type:complete